MKQPKVYIKSLDMVLAVEVINYHEKTVEVFFYDNLENVPYSFDEVIFIYNTGYKDKNDKYIYTGDIVVHNNLRYIAIKKTEEEFYYLTRGRNRCALSSMEDDYLVIGNKYENKELLEVK